MFGVPTVAKIHTSSQITAEIPVKTFSARNIKIESNQRQHSADVVLGFWRKFETDPNFRTFFTQVWEFTDPQSRAFAPALWSFVSVFRK